MASVPFERNGSQGLIGNRGVPVQAKLHDLLFPVWHSGLAGKAVWPTAGWCHLRPNCSRRLHHSHWRQGIHAQAEGATGCLMPWLRPHLWYLDSFVLSIFNLSGGTAQSGRSHCSIQAEPLLNFAGRADFAERRTHETYLAFYKMIYCPSAVLTNITSKVMQTRTGRSSGTFYNVPLLKGNIFGLTFILLK